MSVWDDPEFRQGEFVKFENVGDTVAGTIQAIRKQVWDNGKVDPQLLLLDDNGEERSLTAGQVRLKAELADKRPEVGDHIKVTLTSIEPRGGGKTLKHFEVIVTPGTGQAAPPAPTPATPQVNEQTAAAAIANLTDEQKKALGISA